MKNLYSKLFKVQADMQAVSKDMDNPYFKSKYFDVNSVIGQLKPILSKHGLVVIQPLSVLNDGQPVVRTVVADPESGESAGWSTVLPQNPDPQKQGGLITYFRRYALTSLFLIQGEEDDDANAASGKKPTDTESKMDEKTFNKLADQGLIDPFGDGKKQVCPLCGIRHNGAYPKCYDCYTKNKKV